MKNKTKLIFAIVLIIFVVFAVLIGFLNSNDIELEIDDDTTQRCNLDTYKRSAQPLMQEFSNLVTELEIRDASSRTETKRQLEILLSKINRVGCRDDFPLKHETLEYSVRHMIDAIEYADKGDFAEMNRSIEKSLLNVETFQDWSVDID